jgi:putative ABC transport system permease protein
MSVLHDFRYAVRTLTKDRAFSVVAVLTLTLALGANTAIFSVVNGVLIRQLPFPAASRLMKVIGADAAGGDLPVLSYPHLADLGAQSRTIDGVGIFQPMRSFVRTTGEPRLVNGSLITAEGMRLLGVKPLLGRVFTAEDDRDGASPTIVISEGLWKGTFGGDTQIIGRVARFGANTPVARTIIGVMPSSFEFPAWGRQNRDFWIPLHSEISSDRLQARDHQFLQGFVRLREGVTPEQAQADANAIAQRLRATYREDASCHFRLVSMQDDLVKDVRPALLLLLGAVTSVLLIGCANTANLLLARAARRKREIAIRSAVGATRGRIVAQLLVESVLVALAAGGCGLLLAMWGVDALKALIPEDVPRASAITVDGHVMAFTLALSVATGIIFGLAPALSASKINLIETLKEGSRGSTEGRARNRARNLLVTVAIALSLVLLAGAGLLLRSFVFATDVDPGFDYQHTAVLELNVRQEYKAPAQIAAFVDRLVAAARAIPGVTAAGAGDTMPLASDESLYTFNIVGRAPFPKGQEPAVTASVISPGYLDALRVPLLRGRAIDVRDTATSAPVVLVNAAFAARWFPHEEPLGRRLDVDGVEYGIAGVTANVLYHNVTEEPPPLMYFAFAQQPARHVDVIVSAKDAAKIAPSLRAALRQVDREQPVIAVRTLASLRGGSLEVRRFNLLLLGGLSALALLLAAVGIYSLMSYMVTQRTSEIGIRMALGAEKRDVFRLVVSNALRLVAGGIVIGVAIALAATRVMSSLLFGVHPNDPFTFSAICALIAGVALVASWLPARRATQVDPLVAIRET